MAGSGAAKYPVWLLNPQGQVIKLLDRFIKLKYVLATNGIGVANIQLNPSFDMSMVQEDSQLMIYRQLPGQQKYRDGDAVWLVRDWDWIMSQRGQEQIGLVGYSANEILDRAIVAYAAGTSQAKKSSTPVDNLIKALVRDNLGSLATDADRDKSDYLLVEADLGLGPSTSKSMSWRQLLPTVQELAGDAANLGTPVYFDVIRRPGDSQLFTLATWAGHRGVDRTGDNRVILSVRNGTLSEIKWQYSTIDERNYIYVGGQNQKSDRIIVEVESDRANLSPMARRELFVDARNSTKAGLQSDGEAAINKYRPTETFTTKIRDTKAIRFGRDYNYGDIIIVDIGRRVVNVRVDAVEVEVSRGQESIKAQLKVV